MTRAYVLDQSTRAVRGLVDQSWEDLTYTRRYFGMDTFQMSIQRARLWASELQKGRLLYLPDESDRIFLIEQIQSLAEGSARNDLMTVSGRSMEGITMADRLVIPDAGQAHDRQTAVAAETAMKHYVTEHAGSGAPAARQVPDLNVVASGAAGAAVTVAGRYQYVFDIVAQIGLLTGIGWEVTYNPSTDQFDWDVIVGVDRSASVFFDFAFETLERWEELDSILESKTVAVVAGQGEGEDREVVTRFQGGEPTGFARREAFLDARDIELGQTAELNSRGDAFLAAAAGETRLEAAIHQYGAFRYGEEWDLGDLVTVRNEERDIAYTARVVEVEKTIKESASAPTVVAVLDRPFPTLKEQIRGAGAQPGQADYPDTLNPSHLTLRLTSTSDVSLASTLHALQIGGDGSANIRMDPNEIMAANNGAASDLFLQNDGARVRVNAAAAGTTPADGIDIGGDVDVYRKGVGVLGVGNFVDPESGYRLNGRAAWIPARVEGFILENPAASGTDLGFGRFVTGQNTTYIASPIMGRTGRVVGVVWRKTVAITTGTAQIRLSVAGGASTLVVQLDSGSGNSGFAAITPVSFSPANSVAVNLTTSGTYAPTTIDYAADVLVEYEDEA